MELNPYVDRLRSDLLAVAETAGPEARASAERLVVSLDPAMRMAMLEALSDAAALVTSALPGAAVEVRMKGRDPQLVVTDAAPQPASEQQPEPPGDEEADDDGTVARITVRIPESVKTRAEELAAGRGQSLNGWIVQALRLATRERAVDVDIDLSSLPFGGGGFGPRRSRRVQGWAR